MVIVRLNGGLGNQLFQYAAGFALARKNGSELKIDLTAFDNQRGNRDTIRAPDILQFSLSAPSASHQEVEALKNPLGVISIGARFLRKRIFKQYYSDWHPEILLLKGDVYLDGYFQCEDYFSDCLNPLLCEIRLRSDPAAEVETLGQSIELLRNTVSLHVRRGDYVSDERISALHNICTVDYYQRALAEIKGRVGECNLVVFSDDVDWVRENLALGENVLYVSGAQTSAGKNLSAPQELVLMSRCRHHIISNSTFSWWGAYLKRRADKIVVAPGLWNRSKIDSHKNILPQSWVRLSVS